MTLEINHIIWFREFKRINQKVILNSVEASFPFRSSIDLTSERQLRRDEDTVENAQALLKVRSCVLVVGRLVQACSNELHLKPYPAHTNLTQLFGIKESAPIIGVKNTNYHPNSCCYEMAPKYALRFNSGLFKSRFHQSDEASKRDLD